MWSDWLPPHWSVMCTIIHSARTRVPHDMVAGDLQPSPGYFACSGPFLAQDLINQKLFKQGIADQKGQGRHLATGPTSERISMPHCQLGPVQGSPPPNLAVVWWVGKMENP